MVWISYKLCFQDWRTSAQSVSGGGKRKIHLSKSALHIACLTLKSKSRGLGLSCTFRLLYMPYQNGKGIRYLISRKKEIKFSFLPKRIFFSAKYHFSFLFGIFVAVLSKVIILLLISMIDLVKGIHKLKKKIK